MQRSVFRSLRASRPLLNRRFASSSRSTASNASRWIVPSSIITIGLASYYLSYPLALDSDKSKAPKKASSEIKESPSQEKQEQPSEPAPEEAQAEAEGEEEQGQAAAYNPETGEINWDCPCLGGMAHGPCGEEFKEAFSCFVYSEAEPKGFDCIEKFKNMQNCFRKYPEIYSEEIRDDETPVDNLEPEAPVEAVVEKNVSEAVETVAEKVVEPVKDVTEKILDASIEETPASEASK